MSPGQFPFRPAKPKGAARAPEPSRFEMPAPPPMPEVAFKQEEPEAQTFGETITITDPVEAEIVETIITKVQERREEDMAKKRRGRPPGRQAAPKEDVKRFTLAEIIGLLGETDPVFKVVTRISPIIEVLQPEERERVLEILDKLYG